MGHGGLDMTALLTAQIQLVTSKRLAPGFLLVGVQAFDAADTCSSHARVFCFP